MQTPESGRGRSQLPRRTVQVPEAYARAFRARTRSGGVVGSTLMYTWLWDAVRRARAGLPLPPANTAPPTEGPQLNMLWTQAEAEFDGWRAEIRAAGSSVRAVICDRIRRYTEGSDPIDAADEEGDRGVERVAS